MTATTDADLLLQRVLAEPDCDALRLIYADALDEQGGQENQIRAELIRTMVDVAQSEPDFKLDWSVYEHSDDARKRRTCELVRMLSRYGVVFDTGREIDGLSACVWRRGLIEEWNGQIGLWNDFADSMCARHPIRAVTFSPMYEGDYLRTEWWTNEGNRYITQQAEWTMPNRPTQEYRNQVSYSVLQYNPTLVVEEFRRQVRAATVEVFKKWWPTVKTFEWK